ncbi:hypothetical protein KSF73_03850 [Burkholderiaceae bacterium DAT-1]|nr:hypothetical protein [Burkholderiaceae bacterium DAT-1]
MHRQKGHVFLIFLLLLGSTSLFIAHFSHVQSIAPVPTDAQRRNTALHALLGWALATPDTPLPDTPNPPPGLLPWPDRAGDGNFDGLSDCPNFGNDLSNSRLRLGRIPFRGQRLGTTPDTCWSPQHTSIGGMLQLEVSPQPSSPLWYAASINLLDNADIDSYPGHLSPEKLLSLRSGWITICSASGEVLSSTAALVVLSGGAPLANQSRQAPETLSASARDQIAANYLEPIRIPSGIAPCRGLIQPVSNPTIFVVAPASDTFNDQLTWIDQAEFVEKLADRWMTTVLSLIRQHALRHSALPDLIDSIEGFPQWMHPDWLSAIRYQKIDALHASITISGTRTRCISLSGVEIEEASACAH